MAGLEGHTNVMHHDLDTGHTEVVITAKTHEAAQKLLDFLLSQDHDSYTVYYLDDL